MASGCINNGNQTGNNTSNNTKTYSGDEFTFNYPANWQIITSQAQNSTVAVGDPNSADSNGNAQVNVVIQKAILPSDMTLQDYYNAVYAQFSNQSLGYKPISDGSIDVNGRPALENVYKINSGIQKQERAVWLQNNNVIYIILCSAPVYDYSNYQANFDTIVNSFKLI